MEVLLGIMFAVFLPALVLFGAAVFATTEVYEVTLKDVFKGWVVTQPGDYVVYVVGSFPKSIWTPTPIFWYAGERNQFQAVANEMVSRKRVFTTRNLMSGVDVEKQAIRAKMAGFNIWPSEEIANWFDEEHTSWYPELGDELPKPYAHLRAVK